jgi:hypothetical protein
MPARSASLGLSIFFCACTAANAGLLISRSDKGLQFTDAAQVLINGKDKALSLGGEPKLTGPLNKLKDTKLGSSLLKDSDSGIVAVYSESEVEYLVPGNLPKGAPAHPAALWKSAKIAYKKAANDKTPAEIPAAGFVAFLAGGAEELTHLCMDERALELLGGKNKTFPTQLEWIAATVKAYGSTPAAAPLDKYLESAMRSRYQQFETGTATLDVLNQGLKLAELSQSVYPNQSGQAQVRKLLVDRKTWLDRKVAVLRAFAAAQEWDAFLLGGREFEKYSRAYPEVMQKHTAALESSLALHRDAGERHLKDGDYGTAWREFRLASLRRPSDKTMQQKVLIAWTDYSRQVAVEQQRNRARTSDGDRAAINQALTFADGYLKQNKLDLALKSALDAERIDRNSLQVLLKKAEILGAQREYTKAIATLDEYDRLSVNEERKPAADLRNDLLFKRTTLLDDMKAQVQKAWNDQSFHKILELSREGLRGKDDDADLLYQAGLASLATRDVKQGREMLTRYLEVSTTLDADEAQRARVRTVLATVAEQPSKEQGDPNWMSGKKLPRNVYYDPVSLAFQPRIEHIDATNKLHLTFEWAGDRLRSITPVFDKGEHVTGEKKISLTYEDRVPQVAIVNDETTPDSLAGSPDERFKRSNVVMLNNPYVDPVAVERLTGKSVTIGVAGNRFFNPFVWERPYFFHLTYDEEGRVIEAREIPESRGAGTGVFLEFDWDGMQLEAIRGYQGSDRRASKIYERIMRYQDGRLIGEDIQGAGKSSRINYAYTGDRMVSAECKNDPTLDGRARKVVFK